MTSKGGTAGKDMDEYARVASGGGVEPRQGRDSQFAISGDDAGGELSPGQTSAAAVSGGRGDGLAASECGGRVESCPAGRRTRAGVGARPGEVQRACEPAVWPDVGGRAPRE